MAPPLSTKFAFPGPEFDFNKYAPKSVRAAMDAKTTIQPTMEIDTPSSADVSKTESSAIISEDLTATSTYSDDSLEATNDYETVPKLVPASSSDTSEHNADSTDTSINDESMPELLPIQEKVTPSNQLYTYTEADCQRAWNCTIGACQENIQQVIEDIQQRIENIPQMSKHIQSLADVKSLAEKAQSLAEEAKQLANIIIQDISFKIQRPASTSTQIKVEDAVSVEQVKIEQATTTENQPVAPEITQQIKIEQSTTTEEQPVAPEITQPKSVEIEAEDTKYGPATLITAENFSLDSIPAPNDDSTSDSPNARRLVSIRRIQNIRAVKVKDRFITVAQVDGWTCMVPRAAFKEGQLVAFMMIDSFLPATDKRFGNMATLQTYNGTFGYRVKIRRLGSYPNKLELQGRIYPLEIFSEINNEIKSIRQGLSHIPSAKVTEEQTNKLILAMYRKKDWAEELKVAKWTEPAPVGKGGEFPKLGGVPTRVFRKTDVKHFEDCPNFFTKRKYTIQEYQESIKMDGASMSVYFVKKSSPKSHDLNKLPQGKLGPNMVLDTGRFGVCSKNQDLHELNVCPIGFWKVALLNGLPAKLSNFDRSIAIQGEICGPGINQNREKLEQHQFFVYSMWDIATQRYIDPRKVEELAHRLGLQHVPVTRYVKIPAIAKSHGDLRKLADECPGEGLVYKCVSDGRSFKVHSPTYKVLHDC